MNKYTEISIEELRKQEGNWALWIEKEEMHKELKSIFGFCKYQGPCGYSSYGTHASAHKTLLSATKYWTGQNMPFFVIKNNTYEIY